ncbi:MAG: NAD(P)H-hydrate dehydratase [Candidatus Nanohaloarchaea archaeon]
MEQLLEKLERGRITHKGENGRVTVLGGSKDFSGAPALAAEAALRTGADLVRVLTSEKVAPTVASYSENLIVDSYSGGYFSEENVEKAEELVEWSDVTLAGPGLSEPETGALRQLFAGSGSSFVFDSDAIPAAARAKVSGIYTPHQGETAALKQENGSVERFVDENRATVVVTGPSDAVIGEENFRCERGTPAMTVGGTGDVLSGVIASLKAQGLEGFEAAKLGVWLNGRAGELATEEKGRGLLATDVVEKLPDAMR